MGALFRLGAVGDISFEGSQADHSSLDLFKDVIEIFQQSDLVVGNLECVLTHTGFPFPGKCTLRGSPEWASIMKDAGIGLVSLANNHAMDYGKQGLLNTIEALRRAGIPHVGAGTNRREACSPLFLDVVGRRIAFLARSSVIVSAPTDAGKDNAGVAFLDVEETIATVRSCLPRADLVILLLHWGLEEYSYPSPAQRKLARRFVDAGVSIILGHHPHVIQGFEYYRSAVIAYSLGNFVFDEFEWMCALADEGVSKQMSTLSLENRKGIIATLEWSGVERPIMAATYTRIAADGHVQVEEDQWRAGEMKVLSVGILRRGYRIWWRWYAIRREWGLRLGDQMSLRGIAARLHRLRLRHVRDLFTSLRRSMRIVSEKTTNPYE